MVYKNRYLKIANKLIGPGKPCFIIAEAGSNHNRDLNKALKLIEMAAEAGVDAIKFQVFSAEKIAAKTKNKTASLRNDKFFQYGKDLYDLYKKLELPRRWLPKLKKYADKKGILFSATPFDEEAVDELEKIDVEFYKIASFELVHIPLIKYTARKGKPIILSTGVADLEEIAGAVKAVEEVGNRNYALLHCGIDYPLKMEDVHLAAMDTLQKRFSHPAGYSDHTLGLTVPIAAVARGASIIEKHFTLSRNLTGPDHHFSLEPDELKAMVKGLRDTEKAIGCKSKRPLTAEEVHRNRGRRSIFAKVHISKGTVIKEEMLSILRPCIGILPKDLNAIIGREAKRDILIQEPLTWEDI